MINAQIFNFIIQDLGSLCGIIMDAKNGVESGEFLSFIGVDANTLTITAEYSQLGGKIGTRVAIYHLSCDGGIATIH